jgi:ABC-2 type transport system permease protein
MGNADISSLPALLRKDFMEQLRNGHFLVICIVFAFFGITSPVIAKYTPQVIEMVGKSQNIQMVVPEPSIRDSFVQYVKNLSQLIPIFLIFLTMGGIAKEKDSGTIAFVLVKPVTRFACLFSKLLVHSAMAAAGLMVSAILAGVYTLIFFQDLPLWWFVRGNGALLLYCLSLVAITQGFSAISEKPVNAGIAALVVWIVSLVIKMLPGIGPFSFSVLSDEALGAMAGFSISWRPVLGAGVVSSAAIILGYLNFNSWE